MKRLAFPGITVCALLIAIATACGAQNKANFAAEEGDYIGKEFRFRSGETLPELKLHYRTLGKLVRDAKGHSTNAVLVLHGTGGSGQQFLSPQFAEELYGAGQPLDTSKYFVILPDGIGHGKSSKPSDGMHAHFPSYDYDDMVAAYHLLLTKGLGVDHLRLIFGTSMGCMHSFVWGETFPGFMDALMPMACLPVQIAGRNRMWRKMVMDGIRNDPEWNGGEYREQPKQAVRMALDLLIVAGSAPLPMQKSFPTRDAADKFLEDYLDSHGSSLDVNDLLYQLNASRNYDPSPQLEKITARVMWINSGDDFINPPELGIAQREAKRLKSGNFMLIPASEQTHGHGSHTWAALWKQQLSELLQQTAK
jgi:homoserine O-acetyltransferase